MIRLERKDRYGNIKITTNRMCMESGLLYLIDRKDIVVKTYYFLEDDESRTKAIVYLYEHSEELAQVGADRTWPLYDKKIRVYGPVEVRRIKKPANLKVKRPNPKEVAITRKEVLSYLGGVSTKELASNAGITEEVYRRKLDDIGVLKKNSYNKETLTYEQLIAYGKQSTLHEIARIGNMSPEATLKKLLKAGLSVRHLDDERHKIYRIDNVKFELMRSDVSDYVNGTTVEAIANRYKAKPRIILSKLDEIGALRHEDEKNKSLSREQLVAIIKNKTLAEVAKVGVMTKKDTRKCMSDLGISIE